MERIDIHECNPETRKEFFATEEQPYRFVDSGLDNVYLAGIKYYQCECGAVTAHIPAIRQLLTLMARDIVQQSFSLCGSEIRFLRKRLRMKQDDFAKQLGVKVETLSRIETGHHQPSERIDKFVRMYYAIASKDPVLLGLIQKDLAEKFSAWKRLTPPKKIIAQVADNEWTADLVAA